MSSFILPNYFIGISMPFFVIDSHVHIYTVARVTRVREERIPCGVLVLKPERKTTSES